MKLVRAKNDSSAQQFFAPKGKPTYIKMYENLHVYSYKAPIKKAQPNFLQATRKAGRILIIFVTDLTISFLLLYKLSERRILYVNNWLLTKWFY